MNIRLDPRNLADTLKILEKIVCPLVMLTTVKDRTADSVLAVEFSTILPVIVAVSWPKITVSCTGMPVPALALVTKVPVCKFSGSGGGQHKMFAVIH
jgi:hypothetical protein